MSFFIRPIQEKDIMALCKISEESLLLNLPADPQQIFEKMRRSQKSFAGELSMAESVFVLVAVKAETDEVVGSAQIIGQSGTADRSFFALEVCNSTQEDPPHRDGYLRLKEEKDGSSEVGGLILKPEYRSHSEKVGLLLSLSRFLYIAINRNQFRDRIIAQMLPVLTQEPSSGGNASVMWYVLGEPATGMTYDEADQLSIDENQFIGELLSRQNISIADLDEKVQNVIGAVGETAHPAEKLLKSIGFKYNKMVDPMDGGPHVEATVDNISLVHDTKEMRCRTIQEVSGQKALIASGSGPRFRAVMTPIKKEDGNIICISEQVTKNLLVQSGDLVQVILL